MKHIIGGLLLGAALLAGPAIADTPKQPVERKGPPEKADKPTPPAEKVAVVDINSASQRELEALPGVGEEYCHHIIMGRPYKDTNELVTKGILPKPVYAKIKDRIVAKVEPKPDAKPKK